MLLWVLACGRSAIAATRQLVAETAGIALDDVEVDHDRRGVDAGRELRRTEHVPKYRPVGKAVVPVRIGALRPEMGPYHA